MRGPPARPSPYDQVAPCTRPAPIRHVAGAIFGAQYLGLFLGFSLVEGLVSGPLTSQGQSLGPLVVLLGALVLGAAYVALFPERSLLELSPQLFGLSPASIEDRCEQVAATYGLTPRETQVLSLLARGRDAGHLRRAGNLTQHGERASQRGLCQAGGSLAAGVSLGGGEGLGGVRGQRGVGARRWTEPCLVRTHRGPPANPWTKKAMVQAGLLAVRPHHGRFCPALAVDRPNRPYALTLSSTGAGASLAAAALAPAQRPV